MAKKAAPAGQNKMKIKTGDRVKVIAGKDKGKERVVVEKVNVAKKAMRPTQQNPQGGIVSIEMPIHVSNVMLVCPECKQPTRVGISRETGKRVRTCKKCGKPIDK